MRDLVVESLLNLMAVVGTFELQAVVHTMEYYCKNRKLVLVPGIWVTYKGFLKETGYLLPKDLTHTFEINELKKCLPFLNRHCQVWVVVGERMLLVVD